MFFCHNLHNTLVFHFCSLTSGMSLEEPVTGEFYRLKEILSLANIYTEHKYLRLSLKVHSPREPAGFIIEPAGVFLTYIPVL